MTIAEQAAIARPLAVGAARHRPPRLAVASPSAARLMFLRALAGALLEAFGFAWVHDV